MRRKNIRTRGKLPLGSYFQVFKEGDLVSIVRERAAKSNFPERLQGRTGVVTGKRGRVYMVTMKDQTKEKQFLVEAIHLKKIKAITS